ncbi:MAG: hypothetical protein GC159_20565 [Phycisphaera sp.]|nr:hypothetical protein [Phycisphaera sp.]
MKSRVAAWRMLVCCCIATAISARCDASVVIDFSDSSVVISPTTETSGAVDVTGMTTGDVNIPFLVHFEMNGSNQLITTTSPLGNQTGNLLNVELTSTRNSGTSQTVTITLGASNNLSFTDASWTYLDVDASEDGGFFGNNPAADFDNWQDKIVVDNSQAAVAMTSVNTSYTQVTGNQVQGINDNNVPNNSSNGNVNVTLTGTMNQIVYTYGPGSEDGLEQNQRVGLSNITIASVNTVPEPGATAMLSVLTVLACLGECWRKLGAEARVSHQDPSP